VASNDPSPLRRAAIDLDDEQAVAEWCAHFGITAGQLEEAVLAVGPDSQAVREHLLNQGASSGPG
jgi:hypothetical protein